MMSRARTAVAAAALLLGAVVSLSVTARAQAVQRAQAAQEAQDAQRAAVAELGLTVATGFDGQRTREAWLPVAVGLAPRRAVAGRLVLSVASTAGQRFDLAADVEVASGTRKVFRFVAPPGDVIVRLEEEGADPVAVPAPGGDASGYLVGIVGDGADAGVARPALRTDPLGRSGTWVQVDPAWLSLPRSLESLDSVVLGRDQLAALAPVAAAELYATVGEGADLVIVADRDGVLDLRAAALPWRPAGSVSGGALADVDPDAWVVRDGTGTAVAATVPAGLGRVSVVTRAPDDAGGTLWSAVTGPRAGLREHADLRTLAAQPFGFAGLFRTGDSLPRIPWLAGFLVTYVLLVGPVNGFVLARAGRRELAWLTVPAVTVVFTAGAFLSATGGAAAIGLAGSATWWIDGTGTETVATGVRAPTEGAHTVSVGGDWTARPAGDGGVQQVVRTGAPVRLRTSLRALEFGGLIATRPVTVPAPLALDAVADPTGVTVTVTNRAAEPVRHVVVLVAGEPRTVGDLQPGDRTELRIGAERLPRVPFFGPLAVGPGAPPPVLDEDGGAAATAFRSLLAEPVLDGGPGLAWAIGTQGGRLPRIAVDGRDPVDRGSTVAAGARIVPAAGAGAPATTVQRTLFPNAGEVFGRTPLALEGQGEAIIRLRVPAAGRVGTAGLDLAALPGTAELWDHTAGAWLPLPAAVPAPAERVLDDVGQAWVRVTGWQGQLNVARLGLTVSAP